MSAIGQMLMSTRAAVSTPAFVTPSLEIATASFPGTDVDPNIYDDFMILWSNNPSSIMTKDTGLFGSPVGLLSGLTDTNIGASFINDPEDTQSAHYHWSYASGGGSGGTSGMAARQPTTPGTPMRREFTAPATISQQNTVRISFVLRRYEWGIFSDLIGIRIVYTLSDGSVAPVTYDYSGTVADYGYFGGQIKCDYKPTSSGTLLVSVQELPSMQAFQGIGGYQMGFQAALYKANT